MDLTDGKHRVDIYYVPSLDFFALDFNEKGHIRRYEFAASIIPPGSTVGDWACGTGFGSVILAKTAKSVVGVDINERVIRRIRERYKNISNVGFGCFDILDLQYENVFDYIVSFETLEHLNQYDIPKLFNIFARALVPKGTLIFSVPYMQTGPDPRYTSTHLTYYIDEVKIMKWLNQSGFEHVLFKSQDIIEFDIREQHEKKDIIICIAKKK